MKTSTAKTDFLTTLEVADRLGRTPQYVGMVARELGLGTLINPRLRIFSASEYRAIRAKIKGVARKPVEPS